MLQVLVNISLEKFCCKKDTWSYAKEKMKKRKKKVEKMDTKMSGVLKTMGTKMPAIKKERDSPCSCKYFKFQQERYVSRSIVELG
jgi:hypothetical protein